MSWLGAGGWPVVASAAIWGMGVAGLGAVLTEIGPWYRTLRKPFFQPPDWAFGPAWSLIFLLAAIAAVRAWNAAPDGVGWRLIALYLVNGALNVAWSVLFFRLRRPDWALLELVPFWLSILAMIVGVASFSSSAAWLLAPYLVWVSFAAVLNLAVVRLNPQPR